MRIVRNFEVNLYFILLYQNSLIDLAQRKFLEKIFRDSLKSYNPKSKTNSFRHSFLCQRNVRLIFLKASQPHTSKIFYSVMFLKRLILFPSSNAFARIQARLSFSLAAKLSISAKSYDSLPVRQLSCAACKEGIAHHSCQQRKCHDSFCQNQLYFTLSANISLKEQANSLISYNFDLIDLVYLHKIITSKEIS